MPGTPGASSRRSSTTRPTGRPSIRSCGSAGTPPRGSSRPPPSRRPTSSSSAGAGGPPAAGGNGPTVFSPTIDEVVRESPCDIAVVKQRGIEEIRRVLVPVRGGPHAELALRFADAIARHHDATVVGPAPRPAGDHPRRPGAGRTGARRVHQAAHHRSQRGAPARGAQRPERDPARGREGRPRGHGCVGPARRRRRRGVPVRRAARGDRGPRQADGHGRQDPRDASSARRSISSPPGRRRWPPPTVPPRRRARSRSGSSAGSARPTSTTPSSPTCAGW